MQREGHAKQGEHILYKNSKYSLSGLGSLNQQVCTEYPTIISQESTSSNMCLTVCESL